ncbi:hypothetical protein ACJX0J_022928 [Zea mays]
MTWATFILMILEKYLELETPYVHATIGHSLYFIIHLGIIEALCTSFNILSVKLKTCPKAQPKDPNTSRKKRWWSLYQTEPKTSLQIQSVNYPYVLNYNL